MEISVSRILGLLAGALILLIGVFVLKAKPDSPLHRLFCAFAIADGISTAAYSFSLIPSTPAVQLHGRLVYVHAYIAFVALLLVFGVTFPRPLAPPRWRIPIGTAILAAGAGLMVWHALDPYAFWTGTEAADGVVFSQRPIYYALATTFYVALALIALRLTRLFQKDPSPSHRSQASLVLGGMALGYAPYATTTFLEVFQRGASSTLFHPSPGVGALYASTGLVVGALLYAASVVLRDRRPAAARERLFLLRSFVGVLLLTIPVVLLPGRVVSDLLQQVGLLLWPILLAYAIARYELLDIGPTVRRTATFSLATTVLAVAFFVAEALLENALENTFTGALGAPIVAVLIAGLATAAVFAPISTLAKRFSNRIAPEVAGAAMRARQLEIYRHGVEAAYRDGEVSIAENRVLSSMRASLGISNDDHARIVGELRARYVTA